VQLKDREGENVSWSLIVRKSDTLASLLLFLIKTINLLLD
jgi:hypothetical protein